MISIAGGMGTAALFRYERLEYERLDQAAGSS